MLLHRRDFTFMAHHADLLDAAFWQGHKERIAAGHEPESLDKEVVRRAFADVGYKGDGPIPVVPDEVWSATTARYIIAYERLTGTPFEPGAYPVPERLIENLTKAGLL